mgnify:CR=1 FL=1
MFTHNYVICVKDTDATGRLYFLSQMQIAIESFETFLRTQNFSIASMIKENKFLMPIVHTEADFFSPLELGDEVEVKFHIRLGTKSFTCESEFFCKGNRVGTVSIVHVVVSNGKSIVIPKELEIVFEGLRA